MRNKIFYGILCSLGFVLLYWQFISWLLDNGLDVIALFEEAAQSRISTFAWLDVTISALVLIGFIWFEGSRLKMSKLWLPTLGTLGVGVSFGLPLFLLLREIYLEKERQLD